MILCGFFAKNCLSRYNFIINVTKFCEISLQTNKVPGSKWISVSKAKLHCKSSFCNTKFLRTTPTRALKQREGKVKKNLLKVVLRKCRGRYRLQYLQERESQYDTPRYVVTSAFFWISVTVLWSRKLFGSGTGSMKPQIRIAAPAPERFTRYLENYLSCL